MNLDIPNIVRAAVPDGESRNVRVLSHNGPNHRDPGFLSQDFPRNPPKLFLTAEDDQFDEITLADWRHEGFDVEYIPMGDGGEAYLDKIRALSRRKMDPCETFGIVAYGEAAALCLEHFHVMDNNPDYKLGLLIAYYPTAIPDPKGRFPNGILPLVHLTTGDAIGVVGHSQMVGIQGKRRVRRKTVEPGLGTGGTLPLAYPAYTYDAAPGFAEHDLDDYDPVCAELAWSRSLAMANKAFARDSSALERVVEENQQAKFFARDAKDTLATFARHKTPHVTFMPTLTGGIGAADLERFYARFFRNPPSLRLTLLSRTVGADRVVDELHLRFKHTEPMPWMLPGVPPTGKRVEVVVVSIVAVRGGKLCHEHVYWDQASVLLQIGLLEPKLGPVTARKTGVEMLPVVGREAARRALEGIDDEEAPGEADNDLIRRSANGHRAQSDDEEEEEGEQDGSYGDDSSKAASVSASASQKGDEKKKKALQPSQNGTNRANGMHGANGAAGYDEEAHKENGAGSPESDDVGKPAADSKGKSVAHRPRSSGPPKQKQQTSNPMKATNQADNTAKETASTT